MENADYSGRSAHALTALQRMGRSSGIIDKPGIYKKSPHKIRKTYGSILLDNNIDKRMILDQMGHTDITCTENHYHRTRKDFEEKSERLSNISEFKNQSEQMFR